MDGNGFLELCNGQDDAAYDAACQGYVAAVLDNKFSAREALNKMMTIEEQKKTIPRDARNCMPDFTENNQARKIIVKWFESHPENLHKRVISEAHNAFLAAFPCQD